MCCVYVRNIIYVDIVVKVNGSIRNCIDEADKIGMSRLVSPGTNYVVLPSVCITGTVKQSGYVLLATKGA